jgi:uncharacterized protein YndB with AHSA1/START domain
VIPDSFELSDVIPAKPERIYSAWLNGREHSNFTGSPANSDPHVGGKFTAWDGYISGTTMELVPNKRIIQAWRTTDFPSQSHDSRLEILLLAVEGGTLITLKHSDLPEGQGQGYYQGWIDYYFTPMKKYFSQND